MFYLAWTPAGPPPCRGYDVAVVCLEVARDAGPKAGFFGRSG
jgi:hypothetical protein